METSEREIMQYQEYVYEIARSVCERIPASVELRELVQYGQVGLVEALNKYDETKGVTFKTYAYYRIKGAIYDGLKVITQQLHTRHYRKKFRQMCSDIIQVEGDMMVSASMQEEIRKLKNVIRVFTQAFVVSIDSISEIGIDDSPERHLLSKEMKGRLKRLIAALPAKESRIIHLYYYKGYSLARAGAKMGISRSWASKLHAKAILHLHEEMVKCEYDERKDRDAERK